jgi:hypothetical protein
MSAYPCAAVPDDRNATILPRGSINCFYESNWGSDRKYPKALKKLANGATPSDLVISALTQRSLLKWYASRLHIGSKIQ